MPDFPATPAPSHISAPAILDPVHRFTTDQGYSLRRPMHSRPRRSYLVEWLGRTTEEMRLIRDFVHQVRGGALSFTWIHWTGAEQAFVGNTTPIILNYYHGLVTGQYIWIPSGTPVAITNAVYRVTRLNPSQVALDGTVAAGGGTALVHVYLPFATLGLVNDTWDSPTKLIGPEAWQGHGRFSWALQIQEEL